MSSDPHLPAASELEFEIQLADHGIGDFAVLSFEGTEAISQPFTFDITLVAQADLEVDTHALIGERAVLITHLADQSERYFHGAIAQVKAWQEGTDATGRRWLVRLVPDLWMLGQQRRSRIFQEQSIPDIVKSVLDESQVEQRWSVASDYPPLDYCVQYDESDLDFVSRLLEEAGIFYIFEHEQDAHAVVFADDASLWQPIPGDSRLVFREPTGMPSEDEHVDVFFAQAQVRPAAVELRDFNYLTPRVELSSKVANPDADNQLEVYEYPGGYDEGDAGDQLAQIRLDEARLRAATADGSSQSRRFGPGFTFELDEHPISDLNGNYHLISVDHRGNQESIVIPGSPLRERYRNQFVTLREDVPFRPERVTESPVISGPQTAIVVGPANEEIYCDEHGRVKVQFHWDRDGQHDDRSSCWMRVSQAWAGPGWGALYLPRIGQEVVVEFLEGDPDQPIVTGAVYNGINPPPISLPANKTQSTLRSASSPGSNGSNELRFEDAQGAEEVFLHAQRDLTVVVENDKTQKVSGNETLTVGADRSRRVGGNQTLRVTGDETESIGGDQTLSVGGQRTTSVTGNHSETVGGDQVIAVGGTLSLTVGAAASEMVGAAKSLAVGASHDVAVGASMSEVVGAAKTEDVGGAKSEVVGGDKTDSVGGARTLSVGASLSESIGGDRNLSVGGDTVVNVGGKLTQEIKKVYTFKAKEIVLAADETFTLKVGQATLQFKKGGDVLIQGAKIQVKASGDIILKGSTVTQN